MTHSGAPRIIAAMSKKYAKHTDEYVQRVVDLRLTGMTVQEVADALGYNARTGVQHILNGGHPYARRHRAALAAVAQRCRNRSYGRDRLDDVHVQMTMPALMDAYRMLADGRPQHEVSKMLLDKHGIRYAQYRISRLKCGHTFKRHHHHYLKMVAESD